MSKKTVEKNDPWAPAQPYILQNLADTKAAFDTNQPKLQQFATMQQDTYGRLAPGAETGINMSQGLVNRNLSGANLQGNPYLQGIIDRTSEDVTNRANSQFTSAGRYGSGAHTATLGRELANAENNLRYQDYGAERKYQQDAIGQSQDLMGGASGLLNNAAQLPWIGVTAQNGGTTQLSSPYGERTTTTSDPLGAVTGLIGAGASLTGAIKSDERIKHIGEQVGETPDGLPLYDYTYKDDPAQTPQTGVMAQDVEKVRPDAVGPTGPDGVKSVNYGALGLPDPTTMAEAKSPVDASFMQKTPDVTDRSFGAILGRFAAPDSNDKWGRLGLLGQRLMAGEGSPFQALGRGLISSQEDARATANNDRDYALKQGQSAAQTEWYRAQAAKKAAPPAPAPPPALIASLLAAGIDPKSPEGQALVKRALPGFGYTGEVMGMRAGYDAQTADARAAASAKYRAPPRTSTAPPKYAAGPGGKIMKWVP